MTLGVLALACFAAAIGLLVWLHLAATRLNPVVDAVSDYGTTRYHDLYRAMVIALGGGAVLLAAGLGQFTDASALAWLWVYGAARLAIAGFMTDRDPPPFTREGAHPLAAGRGRVHSHRVRRLGHHLDWRAGHGAPARLRSRGFGNRDHPDAHHRAAAARVRARRAAALRHKLRLARDGRR